MLAVLSTTTTQVIPGFAGTSLLLPAALLGLGLVLLVAALSLRNFAGRDGDAGSDRHRPAARPVPSAETEREAVLRDGTTPDEDDVTRLRRQRLAEAARDS